MSILESSIIPWASMWNFFSPWYFSINDILPPFAAKEHGVKQMGSFQCLNGKIDLSTHEAQHTLEEWEGQLIKLREELSVRVIAKEISAARVPYTVKVLAHKNGEGRRKPGELVVGSSVPGVSFVDHFVQN